MCFELKRADARHHEDVVLLVSAVGWSHTPEDIAVLLLGYKEQMAEMIRTANPGLARRFSFESAFYFEDFTDAELERLLYAAARRKGLTITRKVRKEAVKMLARERIKPNFGNAGAVNNLIGKAALRLASTKGPFATELTLEDIGSVGETASKVDLLAEVRRPPSASSNAVQRPEKPDPLRY